MFVGILVFGVKHSLIHSHNLLRVSGGSVGQCCCFFVFGKQQLNNCFWKIWVALIRASWCDLMQADLLIWADSAGWTVWEVLTVLDEWKMAMVIVLVEVERVKMAVVC